MSTEDPEIILEPGDPGYVEPDNATGTTPEDAANTPKTHNQELDEDVVAPGPNETMPPPAEPAEDLTHVQQVGESDAEFMQRTRGVVVDSQSPSDIVPNTAQTTMGVRLEVEGSDPPVYVGVPPETILEETEGEGEGEVAVEEEPAPEDTDETAESGTSPQQGEATQRPSSPQQGEPITADEPVVITPTQEKKT